MVMTAQKACEAMRRCLENALKRMGLEGVEVLQQNQPVPTSSHSVLLFNLLSVGKNGWQGWSYDKETASPTTMNENWTYLDDFTFQVSAYRPRKAEDGTAAVAASDIVSGVAAFLQSPSGNALLRGEGLMPRRIAEIRMPTFADDSETPQFNPNFDLTASVLQTARVTIPTITDIGERGPEFDDGTQVGAVTVHRGGLYGI